LFPKIIQCSSKKTNKDLSYNLIIVSNKRRIRVPIDSDYFEGILTIPEHSNGGLVIFVHGSGSSGHSPRNQYLSEVLNESMISTFQIDLLSINEAEIDNKTKEYRFNTELLTKRLLIVTDAVIQNEVTRSFKFGYFGSSVGTAVALKAAVQRSDKIVTIVSRSGRLDLVDSNSLMNLRASILLLVGSKDHQVIDMSYKFLQKINRETIKKIITIPGATHLFVESGKFEQVARISSGWFGDNLSHE
jgi:putative phosphoribosyl transferase